MALLVWGSVTTLVNRYYQTVLQVSPPTDRILGWKGFFQFFNTMEYAVLIWVSIMYVRLAV